MAYEQFVAEMGGGETVAANDGAAAEMDSETAAAFEDFLDEFEDFLDEVEAAYEFDVEGPDMWAGLDVRFAVRLGWLRVLAPRASDPPGCGFCRCCGSQPASGLIQLAHCNHVCCSLYVYKQLGHHALDCRHIKCLYVNMPHIKNHVHCETLTYY